MNLLVTGATGFLGRAILQSAAISVEGQLFGSVRLDSQPVISTATKVVMGELSARTEWSKWLGGVDVVVHTAARAHVLRDGSRNPLTEFRRVNRDGTLKLARECALAGVRRFIFISSIGVNGAETFESPFGPEDTLRPRTPYAQSKMEAEQGLRQIAAESGLEVVIIRPPLVYGPKAPGNFGRLLSLVKSGIPLPLGAVDNKRSLVGIDNLVDLVKICIVHPKAPGCIFLVSDGMDVSTTELLRFMGQALRKPARLIPVPVGILKAGAALFGKQEVARQLLGSLQVDISKTRELLGWSPPITVNEGLRRAAQGFLNGLHT
jgi:nucleoside-diphosphate-sugar epimerase